MIELFFVDIFFGCDMSFLVPFKRPCSTGKGFLFRLDGLQRGRYRYQGYGGVTVWSILGILHFRAKSCWLWYGDGFFYEYLHTGFYTLMLSCGISCTGCIVSTSALQDTRSILFLFFALLFISSFLVHCYCLNDWYIIEGCM